MSDTAVHRPIDYVLIEFPGDRVTGAVADTLMDLVERGIIRVYDLLVIRKADDGSFSGIDISDVFGRPPSGDTPAHRGPDRR